MGLLYKAANPTRRLFSLKGLRKHSLYQCNKKGPSKRDSDSLINALVAVLYSSELMVRDGITELGSLIIMRMIIA